jgi:hypothetical protein
MYYVGLSAEHTPTTHCIGVGWSLTPSGPFTDLGPIQAEDGATDLAGRPPGCGDAGGYGNIDAAPFVDDDGAVYLYVSTSRRCAEPTTSACPYEPVLSVYELTETPTRFASERKSLLGATPGGWEQEAGHAAQIENPWVEKRGSTYYLFYSGGYYGASYGMGYATASSPTGDEGFPAFAKSSLNPILAETAQVLSPGGGSVTAGPDGGSWLVYHGRAGDYSQPRTLRIDPLVWAGTSVSTPGPTTGPQTVSPDDPDEQPPPDEPAPTEEPTPEEPRPEPAVALVDVTAPGFALRGRRVQPARSTIVLGVAATTEDLWSTPSGRVRLRGARRSYPLRGGTTSFVARGATHLFRLRLSQKALVRIRRALRRGRVPVARLVVEAHDSAGNTSHATRAIRLSGRAARPSRR